MTHDEKLIHNYGITDPAPVLAKVKKNSDRFDRTVQRALTIQEKLINARKRKEAALKILNKPKR